MTTAHKPRRAQTEGVAAAAKELKIQPALRKLANWHCFFIPWLRKDSWLAFVCMYIENDEAAHMKSHRVDVIEVYTRTHR